MYRVLTSIEALPELEQLLHQRTALGLDHRDEMWEGVLHMVPPAAGHHQDLASEFIAVLRPRAKALGYRFAMEAGLFDPARPHERYRVPDLIAARTDQWIARGVIGIAALVIEILSPDDESYAKLPFYAEMGVAQVMILDPHDLVFVLHRLHEGQYHVVDDGRLDALDVRVTREVDADGPALVLTAPDFRAEIRAWFPPDADGE